MKRDGLWPGALDTPWEEDETCRALVRDVGPMTQAQIAYSLGISLAEVWRIEKRALAKLRRLPLESFELPEHPDQDDPFRSVGLHVSRDADAFSIIGHSEGE